MDPIVLLVINLVWAGVASAVVAVANRYLSRDRTLHTTVANLASKVLQQGNVINAMRADVERMNSPSKRVNF